MKKIPSLILSMILLLSLSACSGNPRQETGYRNWRRKWSVRTWRVGVGDRTD